MTYEYAVYFKLLLLCGYTDELERYTDCRLEKQDELSDLILELSTAGSDSKKKLSILNEYLRTTDETEIDYDKTVFELVMAFLRKKYTEDKMPVKDIINLMYQIACHTGRSFDNPWYTVWIMEDLFYESEEGYIDAEYFQSQFNALILDNSLIEYSYIQHIHPKEPLFKRLLNKIRNAFNK